MRSKTGGLTNADDPQREKEDDDTLTRRRAAANVALLPTDRLANETAAFDVLVNAVYAGHWTETDRRAAIDWVGSELIETEQCDGDEEKVITAIRPTIPASHLESEGNSKGPKYDVALVEAVVLEVAVEFERQPFSIEELLLKVVVDPEDRWEFEIGTRAIRSLKAVGLFAQRTDERIEPTPAALRAVKLLT